MAEITGSQAAETLTGGADDDVITAFAVGGTPSGVQAVRVAAGLANPMAAIAAPDGSGRLFIVERAGLVKTMDIATGTIAAAPMLDLVGEIPTTGERGLLGLAFHPDFAENQRFFVFLSQPDGTSEIREYRLGVDGVAVPGSARTILEMPQPATGNHKGGWIAFGPDGMLYAAVGDGGGSGDPSNNAQNLETLLGKMLRVDVDGDDFAADPLRNYAIPADNPFVGQAGLDEIWAYGLRNPFRNGFDSATGRLFIADVGQALREEINIGAAGANYGWRLFEGDAPYNPPDASPAGLTAPIHVYTHASGDGIAVTGGTVYRGPSEALHGAYIFSDSGSGKLFALQDTDGDGTWTRTALSPLTTPSAGAVNNVVSITEGPDGALYVVDYFGEVFRLDPVLAGAADAGDMVRGGAGRDRAYGGGGADTLIGGVDGDTLFGMAGGDLLFGQDGDDSLSGGAADDTLQGGAGRDTLDGGLGADALAGGTGDDLYLVSGQHDRVIEAMGEGADTVLAAASFRATGSVEVLVLSEAAGAAQAIGAATATRVIGNSAANLLVGLGGADTLHGGAGQDELRGGLGNDRLDGGSGADTLRGGAGGDTYLVDSRADRVIEASSFDADTVIASGADGYWLPAETEVLVLSGAATFGSGNADDNTILGGAQADRLFGQAGNDWMQGNAGADTMWGGAGSDGFLFHAGDGADVIADFDPDEDTFGIVGAASIVTTPTAAGLLITYGATDSVLLRGVASLPLGIVDGGIISVGGNLSSTSPWVQYPVLQTGALTLNGGIVHSAASGSPAHEPHSLAATATDPRLSGGTISLGDGTIGLAGAAGGLSPTISVDPFG